MRRQTLAKAPIISKTAKIVVNTKKMATKLAYKKNYPYLCIAFEKQSKIR